MTTASLKKDSSNPFTDISYKSTTPMRRRYTFLYLITYYCKVHKCLPVEHSLCVRLGMVPLPSHEEKIRWQNIVNRLINQLQVDFFMQLHKSSVPFALSDGRATRSSEIKIDSWGIINKKNLMQFFEAHQADLEKDLDNFSNNLSSI
ncbi:MAG: hypothetical protein J5934_01315 [Succinivibrio sp.]|nr:hypothetical protein [Succinivibrio sp.]